ncbi:MAG TPA: DNA polymerase II [Candidatus Nanoarchaeia archaeon]|nr:DNA polymerase II [Candidatus Nanoarchaeia archaeon]
MKGFIVSHEVFDSENETVLALYGRLENGESFAVQKKIEPYLFISEKDLKKVEKVVKEYEVEKTSLKNSKNETVMRITASSTTKLDKLQSHLDSIEIKSYEQDLKPYTRFCIDNNILGSIDIEGGHEKGERIDRIYGEALIKSADFTPKLKILSIDIETDKKADTLYCLGMYSSNFKKSFIVSKQKVPNAQNYETEEECLQAFFQEIHKFDPDVITGWNVIDFDFKYLQEKCKSLKIPFDIGRKPGSAKLRISSNFMRDSSATVLGRQVLDGLALIQDPFIQEAPMMRGANFNSMTLEDVSQEILHKGKLLKGQSRHKEIDELYKKDKDKLIEYNILDCVLVYEILEKTGLVELSVERCRLTGLPLDRISASIAAFDSLYIRYARNKGLVSPTNKFKAREERIKGGYVKDAKPGIYHDVLVLDFKSLYPSIITTFNIDPLSLTTKEDKKVVESPNGAFFKNQDGVLPEIIKVLHQAREKAKAEKRELSSFAIKIIMNSFFGVLASPNCRYFSLEMANAITAFGRELIQLTAKKIEEKGYKVIYSDTDSVFVTTDLKGKKAEQTGKEMQQQINDFYKEYVKKKYDRTSYLEIEFKKHYRAFMIPALRDLETGAKKRYAGLLTKDGKEELEITGLEAIRGDWTQAAGDFQKELLIKVFNKEKIEAFILDYIKKIKAGKLDDKLVYRKSIRKALDEYVKTTPPHVKAARKLDKLEGTIIQYYITLDGPEPIQKLTHKLDYEHYIDKQIKPIASQVLNLIGLSFEDLSKGSKQTKLF